MPIQVIYLEIGITIRIKKRNSGIREAPLQGHWFCEVVRYLLKANQKPGRLKQQAIQDRRKIR